ncbi:LADA_0A06502g1_1 [Lachancea dasiensis]|uniref:LADA_0A06502g1_1 n=1 Tax=Lachancea dasiensis TaxID=1072105 RepID=A0A1G4IPH4_9SACH|nr:LADA_0A06502g1_1 [Lachancea dasiensis]
MADSAAPLPSQLDQQRDRLVQQRDALFSQVAQLEARVLHAKYDALPLPPSVTSLRALQKFYPLLDIQSFDAEEANRFAVTFVVAGVTVSFRYVTCQGRVESLQVLNVLPSRVPLQRLILHCQQTCNLAFLLSGCYEYARLLDARSQLWKRLSREHPYLACSARSPNTLILENSAYALSLQIHYRIVFDRLPFPSSLLSVTLSNGPQHIPHANDICTGLVREYGIDHGLQQFIKAVLL